MRLNNENNTINDVLTRGVAVRHIMMRARTRGQPPATSSQIAKETVRTRPLHFSFQSDGYPSLQVRAVRMRKSQGIVTPMAVRRVWLTFAGLLCLIGCSEGADAIVDEMALYEDPEGRFELLIPDDWERAPEVSEWKLFAGEPSQGERWQFDATVGLTWGRPPCDWMQVDDVVGWYADRRSASEEYRELTRDETELDGRRALLLEYDVDGREGTLSRELTWFTEAYGNVWEVTCTAVEAERYDEYLQTFLSIGNSLRVYGSWSTAG